ncbi:MAG: hypothetical protein KDD39_04855 [Bdellovibrionales bacterium]|nr:hypothetical protein [Bdellovibrionales bacterium]
MKRSFISLALIATSQLFAAPEPRLLINASSEAALKPGSPAVIELKYIDKNETGEEVVLKDIKTVMGKTMHFVVVKSDLSSFAHFHPFFDPMTGIFQAPIHLPTSHPDNQDATRAFPEAGEYLIYSEVKSISKGILIHALDQKTAGEPVFHEIHPDIPHADGTYVHYLNEKGEKAEVGSRYRTEVTISQTAGEGGDLFNFEFLLKEKTDTGYAEVESLQPWLMMGGHAILLSRTGETAKDRVFAHEHSGRPEKGGRLHFSYFARGGMATDIYRMWMQFKHKGKVLTLPLTFAYPLQ